MHLDQYISDLLYRYECLILPDFGAFLTQYHPAQVHHTTNAFYPPKKQLSFNSQLIENDGLLANYIAKAADVSYEEANQRIASYVRFLFDRLHNKESITLEHIGSFKTGEEHQVLFEPSYHHNYLPEAFGLASFTSPPILREVYTKEVYTKENPAPVVFTPEKRTSRKWMNYAAIGLVAIALSGYGGYNYLKQVENHNFAAQEAAKEQLETKIQEATFVMENPLPAITLAFTKPKGKYHVIAGAFSLQQNAEKKIEQLKNKGYSDAYLMGTNKFGLHQVAYGSFTQAQEALSFLRTIRKDDNREAWLDIKNLD